MYGKKVCIAFLCSCFCHFSFFGDIPKCGKKFRNVENKIYFLSKCSKFDSPNFDETYYVNNVRVYPHLRSCIRACIRL